MCSGRRGATRDHALRVKCRLSLAKVVRERARRAHNGERDTALSFVRGKRGSVTEERAQAAAKSAAGLEEARRGPLGQSFFGTFRKRSLLEMYRDGE